jgi:membrane fusion protein, copper/silver efflux system
VHEAGTMEGGFSPANGQPNSALLTQELSLKEGMYIQKGQTLLMIMDHHQVWAALQIFSADQSLVAAGDSVRLIPEANTADIIDAKIDLMEPFFRPGNNTPTARVYFHNEDMLPIGSHVSATIYGEKKNRLWLPQTSVLSLGMGRLVFRKVAGGFAAHKIITGIRAGSVFEVIAGLDQKDSVAANAQYFTDSESFINTTN